ncbi:MAG: hypothetical protein ACXWT1_15850 [Methylobacter sp.]
MNKTTVAQQANTAGSVPSVQGLLQRKCACGSHAIAGGECEECKKKKSGLQRNFAVWTNHEAQKQKADRIVDQIMAAPNDSSVSLASQNNPGYGNHATESRNMAPGSMERVLAGAGMEQRFNYDFSRVGVYPDRKMAGSARLPANKGAVGIALGNKQYSLETNDFAQLAHKNSAFDEELIDDEPDSGEQGQELPSQRMPSSFEEIPPVGERLMPGAEPLEEGGKKKTKCPSKTVVEKTIDMTPDGIKKGYRTGYGATAVMHVQPDSTNWDGTQIVESLKQTKNTCPEEFKISPCSGNSTFTVGAEAKSSVLGTLEAKSNRFYDFHISRWNKGSLLHDRNPADIDSCQVECEQSYSCGGGVIGKHTVTRTFTKGKSGSRDVTLVAVTKK